MGRKPKDQTPAQTPGLDQTQPAPGLDQTQPAPDMHKIILEHFDWQKLAPPAPEQTPADTEYFRIFGVWQEKYLQI